MKIFTNQFFLKRGKWGKWIRQVNDFQYKNNKSLVHTKKFNILIRKVQIKTIKLNWERSKRCKGIKIIFPVLAIIMASSY